MIKNFLNDLPFSVIKKSLDGYAERQRVIANNIANVNTPGFKAGRVKFEEEVAKAIGSGSSESVDSIDSEFYFSEDNSLLRNDGNNVNLEYEMNTLSKTTSGYKTYLKLAKWKITTLKNAMTKPQ